MSLRSKGRKRLWLRLTRFPLARGKALTFLWLAATALGLFFSVLLYRDLHTGIEELLPKAAPSGIALEALNRRLKSFDYLAVLVDSTDPKAGRRFVDELAQRGQALVPATSDRIEYRMRDETEFFRLRAGLFAEPADLDEIAKYVRERIKYEFAQRNPIQLFDVDEVMKKPTLDWDRLTKKYQGGPSYPGGYYATRDEKTHAVLFYVAGGHSNLESAKLLKQSVDNVLAGMPREGISGIHFTGSVQSLLEEHGALIEDLELSTVLVLILVTGAILFFFRRGLPTSLLLASLGMGTCVTFGLAWFLVGFLNANSAFLASIIVGNGVNFGIIFVARYLEERRRQRMALRALLVAIRTTAGPTFVAAAAAALSYGSLALTQFQGFHQFGIIGFVGMLVCWLSAYTALPALLLRFDARAYEKAVSRQRDAWFTRRLANLVERRAPALLVVSSLAFVVILALSPRLGMDLIETDLSRLRSKQSVTSGSGFYDLVLREIFQRYLSPTVVLLDSRDDARQMAQRLADFSAAHPESDIQVIRTLDKLVPGEQAAKIEKLKEIKASLKPGILRFLEKRERDAVSQLLTEEALHPFTEADLPKGVRDLFTERDGQVGRFVVVEPRPDPNDDVAWNGRRLLAFVADLREIAAKVSDRALVAGQLAISADLVSSIRRDGPIATAFSFLAVVLLVLFLFRRLSVSSAALAALLVGSAWMLADMLLFRIRINFLNFIALPITFGIGVDYGVNVLQRYRSQLGDARTKMRLAIEQTGGAVLLASLTTIIGYGSLIIASNRAFVSFGSLAVLGEIACVAAALLFLPALLVTWERRKASDQ